MESTLILQNPHWKNLPYPGLLDREVVAEMVQLFELKEILIIQGIRRSGKSSVMFLMINRLLEDFPGDEILYINLEDPSFREAWQDPLHLRRLVEMAAKITGKMPRILLLDEIQLVTGWESYIKSVYDSQVFRKIVVTGSNQALLNSNYATGISGRYVSLQILPFSLKERITQLGYFNRLDVYSNKHHISRLIEEMMQYGGFPEICRTENTWLKRRQLIGYFDSILMRDCLSLHAVRDVHLFKSLTTYYLSAIGRPYTYSSLARTTGSNEHTVRDYLSFLTDAWLIKEVYPWSPAIKSLVSGPKKGYCADNGLININSLSITSDYGWLFENLVFTELLHCGMTDIRFYSGKRECDFIVNDGQTITAIQACFDFNKDNQERETAGLIEALEKTGAAKGFIVTPFSNKEISDKVSVIPLFDACREMLNVE
jgi:predicted AAA+ superfamily ATPase